MSCSGLAGTMKLYRQMWKPSLPEKYGVAKQPTSADGNFTLKTDVTPVRDGNGQISHFIAIKQDVTDRKLIYAQLENQSTAASISTWTPATVAGGRPG
jgi:hypothetical protein